MVILLLYGALKKAPQIKSPIMQHEVARKRVLEVYAKASKGGGILKIYIIINFIIKVGGIMPIAL